MIVFAHMMKTGGTSFLKMLMWHFGKEMLVIPGGLHLDALPYGVEQFRSDQFLMKDSVKALSGHVVRPYQDYGPMEREMNWITFVRDPVKRYVSHYHHSINWDSFYRKHGKDSIIEWEKRFSMGNYQVRFLAGEENLQKAIDILNQKIKWVGITEKFEESCCSFKNYLGEDDFHIELKRTNSSLSNRDEINEILFENQEFILENNQLDADLYRYILTDVWPEQAKRISIECDKRG